MGTSHNILNVRKPFILKNFTGRTSLYKTKKRFHGITVKTELFILKIKGGKVAKDRKGNPRILLTSVTPR